MIQEMGVREIKKDGCHVELYRCDSPSRLHGGGPDVTPGKPLHDTYTKEDLVTLKEGCKNLAQHIKNSKKFGIKVLVAINQFAYVQ